MFCIPKILKNESNSQQDLANFLKTAEGREIRNIISEKLKEANIESEVEKSKQPAKKTTAKTE